MEKEEIKELFQEAEVLIQLGEKEEALKVLSSILVIDPKNITVRLMMEQHVSRLTEAKSLLKEVKALQPDNIKASMKLVRIYIKEGNYDKAKELMEDMMRCYPKSAKFPVEWEYIDALERRRTPKEVEELSYLLKRMGKGVYNSAKQSRDSLGKEYCNVFLNDISEFLKTVNLQQERKRDGQKCDIYCVKNEMCGYEGGKKGDGHSLHFLTIITNKEGEMLYACPSDELTLEERQEDKKKVQHWQIQRETYYGEAQKEYDKGNYEEYLGYMKTYLHPSKGKITGVNTGDIFRLARAYEEIGNLQQRDKLISLCLKMNPEDIYGLTFLAQTEYEDGNLEKAKRYLEKAEELKPNSSYVQEAWINIYQAEGKEDKVREILSKLRSIKPSYYSYPLFEIESYEREGNFDKAEELLEKNISIPKLKLILAQVLLRKGKQQEAKQQLEEILQTNPRMEAAICELAKIEGCTQRAKSLLQQEYDANYIGIKGASTLSDIEREEGNFSKAKEILLKAKAHFSTNPYIRLKIEQLHAIEQQEEDKKEFYSSILRNIGEGDKYKGNLTLRQMRDHTSNNYRKPIHGVCTVPIQSLLEELQLGEGAKMSGEEVDIYCIEKPGCAYQGGYEGDGHTLDYLTIITLPGTDKIISIFPSDETVREKEKEEEERE